MTSPPETSSLLSGTHDGFMLRAAASIEKQTVYSGKEGVKETSRSEGLQLPKGHDCIQLSCWPMGSRGCPQTTKPDAKTKSCSQVIVIGVLFQITAHI